MNYKKTRKKIFLILIFDFLTLINFAQTRQDSVLSSKELQWLDKNKNDIIYIENYSWPTGKYIENENHKAIVSEYIKTFEKKLGIKFKRRNYQTWDMTYKSLLSGEGDLIEAIQGTKPQDTILNYTEPFLYVPLVVLVKKNLQNLINKKNINKYKIAVVKGYSSIDYLEKKYKNIKIYEYKNNLSSLLATSLGKTDATVIDLMSATYIINKYKIDNLRIATKLDYTWKLRFGTRKDKPELNSILNKILLTISEEQRQAIYNKWVINYLPENNFLERNKTQILILLFLLIVSILSILVAVYLLKKQVKTKTQQLNKELSEKQKLLELHKKNEQHLESLLKIQRINFNSLDDLIDFSIKEAAKITESSSGFLFTYNATEKEYELTNYYFEEKTAKISKEERQISKSKLFLNLLKKNDTKDDFLIKNNLSEIDSDFKENFIQKFDIKKMIIFPLKAENGYQGALFIANKTEDYNKSDANRILILISSIFKKIEKHGAERKLIIAKNKAEESNKLKNDFLHNMSHEIRTPMNAIMGFADLLLDEKIQMKDVKYYSKIIKNSGEQLLRIIDDILDISRLETKKVKLIKSQFCLNDLIFQLFNAFENKAKEQNIALYTKKTLSDKNSIIQTDQTKLVKIISNLIDNSLKYTKQGQVEFGYYIENKELIIFVKDTGVGIEESNRDIIFERFRRAEDENTSMIKGLGLGLSIVKENVEILGGKLEFISKKDEGTTFFVKLKLENIGLLNTIDKTKKMKYKILIAEDDEINFLYLESLLQLFISDAEIIHAKNGQEAVKIVNTRDIDFVFMDLKMPQMDGFEATKRIKEIKPQLKIIAQTAYSGEEDKIKALNAGCDDFLSKPMKKSNIHSILNKYLFDKKEL